MSVVYKKRQFGWVIFTIIISLTAIILIFGLFLQNKDQATKFALAASSFILLLSTVLFHSLTVIVTNEKIRIFFGFGFIKKEIDLENVVKCEPVKNNWYIGWGIRIAPDYTLYNVSGFDAVELTLKDKKRKIRIGTEDPAELTQVIKTRLLQQSNAWR